MYEKQASFDSVRVERDKLLLHLAKNREAHRALFEEAMEGYRVQAIEILEDHIQRISNNKPERVVVSLPLPEDHTDDYDRVIEMIQWSIDDEIWLDANEFNQYVRDQWLWKEQFLATAMTYTR